MNLDGNMTTNGVWAYAWDAENRLITLVGFVNLPSLVLIAGESGQVIIYSHFNCKT